MVDTVTAAPPTHALDRRGDRPGWSGHPAGCHDRDQEVLRDYQSVLGPEATIAGPAAVDIRSGELSDEAVD